eukprot:448511_1
MPRKASLDGLINDINKLQPLRRGQYALFVMDLDHLKCWNTCIGHVKTDLLIQQVGNVMKKYVKDINDGIWDEEEKGDLEKAFTFRTGGDEFVIAVQCREGAYYSSYGPFYSCIKKDINNIGSNIKGLIFDNDEKEWNDANKKLSKAKDRDGKLINMNIVGISTGVFIPCDNNNKEKDWLSLGDMIALEHAKTIHLPNKNGTAIYYEE